MSVEVGAFRELQTGLNAGQIAVLIDTREDEVEDEPRGGLVLHHPRLNAAQQRQLVAGDDSFLRIPPALNENLRRLRKLRHREAGLSAQAPASQPELNRAELAGSLISNYYDPVAPENSRPVTATFEPVRIEGRSPEVLDTGWIVGVHEDPLQASDGH
jgi:hypothetical protein